MLRDDEVRRLIAYLRTRVSPEELAAIEDQLRSEESEDVLRTREFLAFFPAEVMSFSIAEQAWRLELSSHARLRLVQRGVKTTGIRDFVARFHSVMEQQERIITSDRYALVGRLRPRQILTLRLNIEEITERAVQARVITVHRGRGGSVFDTVIDLT